MRKITSILSMFLLIAGWNTASAQFAFQKFAGFGDDITDVSQLEEGGYYVLQNYDGNRCIKIKTDGSMVLGFDDSIKADDASDGLAVFKLHIDNSGTTTLYSFESACAGYYIPTIQYDHHRQGGVVVSTTEGKFELKTQATVASPSDTPETKKGYFIIKNSTDDNYLDVFTDKNLLTGWKGRGARAWFKIRKATLNEDASAEQVFYKTVTKGLEGEVISTAYGIATTGETYNYTTLANVSYYFPATQPSDLVIRKDNNSFEFNLTKGEVPFTAGQWYSLKIENGGRVLRADAENNSLFVNTNSGPDLSAIANNYTNFLDALWRIEESGYGVKIYNKGIGQYLKVNGSGTGKANRVSFDNTGTVFYVRENKTGLGFYTGSGYGYLNACCNNASDTPNACLGVWNDASSPKDGGSRLLLELSGNELLPYGKAAFAATGNISYTICNALKKGDYSQYQTQVEAATTLDELFNITDNVTGVYPEAGAYYLIRNVNQGAIGSDSEGKKKYLTTTEITCDNNGDVQTSVNDQTIDLGIKRLEGTSAFVPRLWKFEKTEDGKYNLLNVNTNSYVNVANILTTDNQSQKDAYEIYTTETSFGTPYYVTNDKTTMFVMSSSKASGDKLLNAAAGYNSSASKGVGTWHDNDDASNYWQFIKVTEVPLTIAANDYTTLCLPFNVQLPENSAVKAYYASAAAGEVLKLEEITNGIIPANEGVILHNTSEAEAANINLAITTEEATLTNNKLEGVTAKREGYTALSNYVLAAKNGTTGFYKAKFTAITANKAYLPSENITNAQGVMMAFSFGDEVTGIDNVNAAAPAAKKYYDLQGRRVLYPAKGIFVTEDGQKVLFK